MKEGSGLSLKFLKLKKIIKDLDSALLAYSGGLDSSFLLMLCKDILGNRILAVTASSYSFPRRELKEAKNFAKKIRASHLVIKSEEFKNKNYLNNSLNRCYYCKKELFYKLRKIARNKGIKNVIDGSNLDDCLDYRPGSKAAKELGVHSPLREAGMGKNDIRILSKKLGFSFWDKPPYACLSSRLPYNTWMRRYSSLQL